MGGGWIQKSQFSPFIIANNQVKARINTPILAFYPRFHGSFKFQKRYNQSAPRYLCFSGLYIGGCGGALLICQKSISLAFRTNSKPGSLAQYISATKDGGIIRPIVQGKRGSRIVLIAITSNYAIFSF